MAAAGSGSSSRSPALSPSIGLAGAGLLSALSPAAFAQTATSTGTLAAPVPVPEIGVSASELNNQGFRRGLGANAPRSAVPIAETPQSITVVPKEIIEQQRASSLRDALRNVTGISLTGGEGGFTGDNLTLRGFSARSDFFIDGIRDIGQYTRDTFFLDHVEVLKGPSSIAFGRGSTGGAVNQSSRMPGPVTSGEVSISGYSSGGVRATTDVNVRAGDVAARMAAMATRIDAQDRGLSKNERWGIAPSITWGMDKPTQITLQWLHQQENNTPDFGVPYLGGRPAPAPTGTYFGLADLDREKTTTDVVTARISHAFDDRFTLRNTTRYGGYSRDISATAPRFTGATTGPLSTLRVTRQAQVREGYDSLWTNQTEGVFDVMTGPLRHRGIIGGEVSHESSELTRFTQTGRPIANFVNPNPYESGIYRTTANSDVKSTGDSWAVYAVDQIELGKYFEVVGGLRYDSFDLTSVTRSNAYRTIDRNDDKLTYRAALVFKPTPSIRTYISTGTSFNPSAEALTLAENQANLPPEDSTTYEAGIQWEVLENLRLTGSVFRILKDNARTPGVDGDLTLAGDVRVDGFEIQAQGAITKDWSVMVGYTRLDSEIRKSGTASEVGKEFANVSPNNVSLWTSYNLPDLGPIRGLQLGGGLQFVDRRYANTGNTVRVPSFTRYDAALAWEPDEGALKGVRFQINALNLGDTRAYETVYTGHVIEAPGRTFIFTAAAKF